MSGRTRNEIPMSISEFWLMERFLLVPVTPGILTLGLATGAVLVINWLNN